MAEDLILQIVFFRYSDDTFKMNNKKVSMVK